MTSEHSRHSAAGGSGVPERREIIVRRAPKFVPFLVAGGILGIVAAAVVAWVAPGNADYDRSTIFGFFAVLLAVPGVVLGGIVALIFDRVSIKRMERAVVESAPEAEAQARPAQTEPDAQMLAEQMQTETQAGAETIRLDAQTQFEARPVPEPDIRQAPKAATVADPSDPRPDAGNSGPRHPG